MRLRKRQQNVEDSFELFLDTITNTFGGVLLIALLIALLIREPQTSETDSDSTKNNEVATSEIAALKAEKSALELSLKTQQNFAKDFQKKESKSLIEQLAPLLQQNASLERTHASLNREVSKLKTKLEKTKLNISKTRDKLTAQQSKLERLNTELRNEQQLRTRTTSLPKETSTQKIEVAIFVDEGQLFFVNKNRPEVRFQINLNHFESCAAADSDLSIDSKYYRIRPGQGVSTTLNQLKQKLRQYSKTSSFLTFVVRSNSFAEFAAVKDACVRSGFEYRIIPTDDLIGESAGVSAKTQ